MEMNDRRVHDCCVMVEKGRCRDLTIVCDSEEEASDVLLAVLAWIRHEGKKKKGVHIHATRSMNEVRIMR